jgi:diaminopimelate decarboxylase
VGSQIFETEPYLELVRVMFGWYQRIREQTGGLVLPDMNLGGGLGIAYTANDDPPDVGQTLASVLAEVQREAARLAYPLPRLLFEPGRSMVATAGVTLYTVGSFKDVSPSAARPEGRRYVAVDGGMGDNIRPSLYQAGYTAKIVTPGRSTAQRAVALAGKYCESGDVLIPALDLPEDVAPGDHLVVFGTGAYNYVMASNYNRVPRPAMVWVENGQAQVLVRRETWEDLLQYDQMPQVVREV